MVSNNKELKVEFKSLHNPNKVFKTLYVGKEDKINFKNSPILQEGSAYSFGGKREMEKNL